MDALALRRIGVGRTITVSARSASPEAARLATIGEATKLVVVLALG